MSKHSRYDYEHYKNCRLCYDEHLDFEDELRQEALMDAIEAQGGQDD